MRTWILILAGCPQTAPFEEGPPPSGLDLRLSSEDPSFGSAIAAADLDGDGAIDVAVSDREATRVFLGLREDRTAEQADVVLPGSDVTAADTDGDGIPELLTTSWRQSDEPVIQVHEAPLGGAPRLEATVLESDRGKPALAVVDIHERDGAELLVGAAGFAGRGLDHGARLFAFSSDASGAVTSDEALVALDAAFSAEWFEALDSGDATGDGSTDLLFSFGGFDNSHQSYFVEGPLPEAGALEALASTVFPVDRAHLVGDLDGDGRPDIGAPSIEGVLFWTSPADLDPGDPIASVDDIAEPQRTSIRPAGDLDGDGRGDVWIDDPAVPSGTRVVFGPIAGSAVADLILELPPEGVRGFALAAPLADLDGVGGSELLLGSARDISGQDVGLVWLVGLPRSW